MRRASVSKVVGAAGAVLGVGVLIWLFISLGSTDAPSPWLMVVGVVVFPAVVLSALLWTGRRRSRGEEDSSLPMRYKS